MELKRVKFSESENIKLLNTCWIAGERKYSSAHFVKLFARNEINAVNIVASCEQIREIIEANQQRRETQNALQTRSSCGAVAFKDITRLTFGACYILRQQATTLLDETKHLLDQIMGNNVEFACLAGPKRQLQPHSSRKRKQSILKQTTMTTVCVSKRARSDGPQLLDEQNVNYYKHMLSESQLWSTESEGLKIDQTIQMTRTCFSEHLISVTHEQTLTALDQDLMWNEGFGEPNQTDLISREEFLPFRNSLKRKSADLPPSGVLCHKVPRLEITELDVPIINNEVQTVDLLQEIDQSALLPLPSLPPAIVAQSRKRKRKCKLQLDTCIKLPRETLMRDRLIFSKRLESAKVMKPAINKNSPSGKTLLNSLRQQKLFPDCLKARTPLTSEQLELDCESTIRTIIGADYSDALASEILSTGQSLISKTNALQDTDMPVNPDTEHQSSQPIELQQGNNSNNNNNNVYEHIQNYENNHFDSLKIMMDLLNIWRKNPDGKTIDANKFVKSFPDRIQAALAFSHLLTLSQSGFVELSTKPGSLEIDAITLGAESNILIENISSFEQM